MRRHPCTQCHSDVYSYKPMLLKALSAEICIKAGALLSFLGCILEDGFAPYAALASWLSAGNAELR